jgi:hypothetical protein
MITPVRPLPARQCTTATLARSASSQASMVLQMAQHSASGGAK